MKLTLESINHINLFEGLTRAKVKDSFVEDGRLVFLVEEGSVMRALGRDRANPAKISRILKKEVKIIAFSKDVCKFVSNLIYPNRADRIILEGRNVKIVVNDPVVKGRIFGRGRENMKRINTIVKNYFDVECVVV